MSSIIAQARQWLAEREPGRWEAYDDHGIVSLRDADRDAPLATDLNPEDLRMFESLPDLVRELLRMEAERDELARDLQNIERRPPCPAACRAAPVASSLRGGSF